MSLPVIKDADLNKGWNALPFTKAAQVFLNAFAVYERAHPKPHAPSKFTPPFVAGSSAHDVMTALAAEPDPDKIYTVFDFISNGIIVEIFDDLSFLSPFNGGQVKAGSLSHDAELIRDGLDKNPENHASINNFIIKLNAFAEYLLAQTPAADATHTAVPDPAPVVVVAPVPDPAPVVVVAPVPDPAAEAAHAAAVAAVSTGSGDAGVLQPPVNPSFPPNYAPIAPISLPSTSTQPQPRPPSPPIASTSTNPVPSGSGTTSTTTTTALNSPDGPPADINILQTHIPMPPLDPAHTAAIQAARGLSTSTAPTPPQIKLPMLPEEDIFSYISDRYSCNQHLHGVRELEQSFASDLQKAKPVAQPNSKSTRESAFSLAYTLYDFANPEAEQHEDTKEQARKLRQYSADLKASVEALKKIEEDWMPKTRNKAWALFSGVTFTLLGGTTIVLLVFFPPAGVVFGTATLAVGASIAILSFVLTSIFGVIFGKKQHRHDKSKANFLGSAQTASYMAYQYSEEQNPLSQQEKKHPTTQEQAKNSDGTPITNSDGSPKMVTKPAPGGKIEQNPVGKSLTPSKGTTTDDPLTTLITKLLSEKNYTQYSKNCDLLLTEIIPLLKIPADAPAFLTTAKDAYLPKITPQTTIGKRCDVLEKLENDLLVILKVGPTPMLSDPARKPGENDAVYELIDKLRTKLNVILPIDAKNPDPDGKRKELRAFIWRKLQQQLYTDILKEQIKIKREANISAAAEKALQTLIESLKQCIVTLRSQPLESLPTKEKVRLSKLMTSVRYYLSKIEDEKDFRFFNSLLQQLDPHMVHAPLKRLATITAFSGEGLPIEVKADGLGAETSNACGFLALTNKASEPVPQPPPFKTYCEAPVKAAAFFSAAIDQATISKASDAITAIEKASIAGDNLIKARAKAAAAAITSAPAISGSPTAADEEAEAIARFEEAADKVGSCIAEACQALAIMAKLQEAALTTDADRAAATQKVIDILNDPQYKQAREQIPQDIKAAPDLILFNKYLTNIQEITYKATLIQAANAQYAARKAGATVIAKLPEDDAATITGAKGIITATVALVPSEIKVITDPTKSRSLLTSDLPELARISGFLSEAEKDEANASVNTGVSAFIKGAVKSVGDKQKKTDNLIITDVVEKIRVIIKKHVDAYKQYEKLDPSDPNYRPPGTEKTYKKKLFDMFSENRHDEFYAEMKRGADECNISFDDELSTIEYLKQIGRFHHDEGKPASDANLNTRVSLLLNEPGHDAAPAVIVQPQQPPAAVTPPPPQRPLPVPIKNETTNNYFLLFPEIIIDMNAPLVMPVIPTDKPYPFNLESLRKEIYVTICTIYRETETGAKTADELSSQKISDTTPFSTLKKNAEEAIKRVNHLLSLQPLLIAEIAEVESRAALSSDAQEALAKDKQALIYINHLLENQLQCALQDLLPIQNFAAPTLLSMTQLEIGQFNARMHVFHGLLTKYSTITNYKDGVREDITFIKLWAILEGTLLSAKNAHFYYKKNEHDKNWTPFNITITSPATVPAAAQTVSPLPFIPLPQQPTSIISEAPLPLTPPADQQAQQLMMAQQQIAQQQQQIRQLQQQMSSLISLWKSGNPHTLFQPPVIQTSTAVTPLPQPTTGMPPSPTTTPPLPPSQ